MNVVIPRLGHEHALQPLYLEFLAALPETGFRGDISRAYAQRLITATDNSVYQRLPQAVVFPRDEADVVHFAQLAGQAKYRKIRFSPRGGGTGTNGQSLTDGIVVDVSRHMNAIIELDLDAGWVKVQPGVVLDQLNAELRPHGVFFAPNLSPSNRATIGGMINTDACGKGSRVYGKTSQHVTELRVVLANGERMTCRRLTPGELERVAERDDRVGATHRTVAAVVEEHADEIEKRFPKLDRFLTGYNLAHVGTSPQYAGLGPGFDMNAILCGSEGTLAFITQARLRLTPLPRHRQLFVLRYACFDDALADARRLVELDPGAIETIDETILALARKDAIWHEVGPLLAAGAQDLATTKTINLVEFESDEGQKVRDQAEKLEALVRDNAGADGRCMGLFRARTAKESRDLWNLRKKGVGLLGAKSGERRPVPFVEDTAVPPHRLAEYIRDFRALLDDAGLEYGMFGHVDVGCLHVRPALNLRDEADEALLRQVSDAVMELVQRYGGVMWSEHGKGFRSEYSPRVFGTVLYQQLCRIKACFDPHDQMNPGKLATADADPGMLVSIDALKRGSFDRQIEKGLAQRHSEAIHCNGNGACFNYDPDAVMCPSAKITRDRVHSPKGRAGMMREWMRQLSGADFNGEMLAETARNSGSWAQSVARWLRPRHRKLRGYDFSDEVYDAMQGCLSCKACATQCPIKVDVPEFKASFLSAYHTRYRRPLVDHAIAGMERVFPLFGAIPGLVNALTSWGLARWLTREVMGLVDTPKFSRVSARARLAEIGVPMHRTIATAVRDIELAQRDGGPPVVIILQDTFTTYCDSQTLAASCEMLQQLGYRPHVAPMIASGKGLHVKGFLRQFEALVRRNVKKWRALAATKAPLIGIEPIIALMHRDEYCHVLGDEEPGYEVSLLQEWLDTRSSHPAVPDLFDPSATESMRPSGLRLFAHCTERTALAGSERMWQRVFARLGIELEVVDVGCCGMCGAFGHEATHVEESKGIYDMGWRQHLASGLGASSHLLATGYSCRVQASRCDALELRHPARALLDSLRDRVAATDEFQAPSDKRSIASSISASSSPR